MVMAATSEMVNVSPVCGKDRAGSLQIWAVEATLYRDDEYSMKQNKLLASAKSTGFIYRDYIYGAVVNLTVLEVVKCVVGSPRPTFFDLCQPEEAKTCVE
ncbi:Wunen [Operophtera brumata]|uniref:Wunen n=1 Tax=Operophtera brumata TaxID=104452 RepID=A0A0L7LEM2_OPEBR|nr:Wunen [Operophtera brumata]